jgi:hypothetical protein
MDIVCRDCQVSFEHPSQKGRPPVRCAVCKEKMLLAAGKTYTPKPVKEVVSKEVVSSKPLATVIPIKAAEVVIPEEEPTLVKEKPVAPAHGTNEYEVFCTNMGYAYRGDSKKDAEACYEEFVQKSVMGFGQCGREIVSLFHFGELVVSFNPHKELV